MEQRCAKAKNRSRLRKIAQDSARSRQGAAQEAQKGPWW